MTYVFFADGMEEIEALTPVDLLRRAGLTVITVGIGKRTVKGRSGIEVTADKSDAEITPDKTMQAVILPGGMPGAEHLDRSKKVEEVLFYAKENSVLIAAICAAPMILGHKGLLKGVRATCFPGFEKDLDGAVITPDSVCYDKGIVTAKGAGVALDFSLKITEILCGKDKSDEVRKAIQCPDI